MQLREKALLKRAKKLESKGSLKINFNPACLSGLEKLLHDIYISCQPKPNEYHHRRDLVRIFNMIAKEIYGSCSDFPVVEVFGSFVMDLFSAKSDLDLSVNFSNDSVELPRIDKIKVLRKFAKKLYSLQSNGHVYGVFPIMSANVPIVKVVDRGTGIECDVSVDNKDGIAKSQIILIISTIDERFKKLSHLMKAWAKAYDINSSKDRTLNSLSIILLVAFHLQTRDPPILPHFSALLKDGTSPANVRRVTQDYLQYGKRNGESLAELFGTLLSKLASVETLWSKGLCVSTFEGSWIYKRWVSKGGSTAGNMSVEDFTDRSQNVARAVGKAEVKNIYKCIHGSLHHLSAFVDDKILASNLKARLFGLEDAPRDENDKVNLKRSLTFEDATAMTPHDPILTKRVRTTDGWATGNWRCWTEVNKPYGEIPSCFPQLNPPIPSEHPGLQQTWTPSLRPHAPPQTFPSESSGLQHHLDLVRRHGLDVLRGIEHEHPVQSYNQIWKPGFSAPVPRGIGQGHSVPSYNQTPREWLGLPLPRVIGQGHSLQSYNQSPFIHPPHF